MKLISNTIFSYNKNISFKQNQTSILESHIKQTMSENFNEMLNVAKQDARNSIKDEFYKEFNQKIDDHKNSVTKTDTKNILSSLIAAYKNAALDSDVKVLDSYIKENNL